MRAPQREAVFTVVPFEDVACAGAIEPNRSHSESDWPGSFTIEQSPDVGFAPEMSCAAMGIAATQPVRLNKAKAAKVMRAIMSRGPFRCEALTRRFSPVPGRQLKGRLPRRFSEGSWAD
jgi:hypothetical protein